MIQQRHRTIVHQADSRARGAHIAVYALMLRDKHPPRPASERDTASASSTDKNTCFDPLRTWLDRLAMVEDVERIATTLDRL